MTLRLRPHTSGDLNTLYKIDQACYEPGIAYSQRELRWYLAQHGAECLVAEADEHIVGFIVAHEKGARAHIITIDVLEPWRRKGVGTALLAELERRLQTRGVCVVELETATANEPGVAFWQKSGYRTVGMLKGYYLGRLDAFSMRKFLPAPATEAGGKLGDDN
jgi:ribosomal-protein-alanine N-acetyltransferase